MARRLALVAAFLLVASAWAQGAEEVAFDGEPTPAHLDSDTAAAALDGGADAEPMPTPPDDDVAAGAFNEASSDEPTPTPADAAATTHAVADHLERAIGENETLLQTLHEFARRVRPAVLDDLGLRDAMESHVMEFRTRTQVETVLRFDCDPNQLPTVIADNVFRLVQESLNNVAKHAKATHVEVLLSTQQKHHDKDSELLVMIRDNGCGTANCPARS